MLEISAMLDLHNGAVGRAGGATLRDYKQRILRVLIHIQQNLDSPLNLDDLAVIACFSPYHFHRVFKGMIGESLMGHIRRLRIERAAFHLKTGNTSVTQIAFDAGYETHESFTRAFKSAFGLAPNAFRQRHRANAAIQAASGVHYQAGESIQHFKTHRKGVHTMNIQIKNVAPKRVAFMRHVGPYHEVGAIWEKLATWMGAQGWLCGKLEFIGLCHDDPEVTPPDKIRYDACITVPDNFVPSNDVGVQVIPGGEYAVTTHFGPYEKLTETYMEIFGQWLPRSGRELGNCPSLEIYINDPCVTPPKDLITDIYVPLQPLRKS
jgi:AraC family transcriptional regulator